MTGLRSYAATISVLVALAAVLGACGRSGEGTEPLLRERLTAYYEAQKAHDMVGVYQLESGSLPGGTLKPHAMKRRMAARVVDYTLKDVTITGNEAEAHVSVGYIFGGLQKTPIFKDHTVHWVFVDGNWYHKTGEASGLKGLRKGKQKGAVNDPNELPADSTSEPAEDAGSDEPIAPAADEPLPQ